MSDPVNDATVALITRNEGCVLHAYPDPATGGEPWTIGFGHTGDVRPGETISRDDAMHLLEEDLIRFEDGVDDALDADTTDNQFGAMVSLAYNIGLGNFRRSTVLRKHNAGDHAGAADAFLMWTKAAGEVMAGLVRRRHEERALYLTPDHEEAPGPVGQVGSVDKPQPQSGPSLWAKMIEHAVEEIV